MAKSSGPRPYYQRRKRSKEDRLGTYASVESAFSALRMDVDGATKALLGFAADDLFADKPLHPLLRIYLAKALSAAASADVEDRVRILGEQLWIHRSGAPVTHNAQTVAMWIQEQLYSKKAKSCAGGVPSTVESWDGGRCII